MIVRQQQQPPPRTDEACTTSEFVDRPEFQRLIDALGHRSITIGLAGPRGSGKSELLKAAFRDLASKGRELISDSRISEFGGLRTWILALPLLGEFYVQFSRTPFRPGALSRRTRGPVVVPPIVAPTQYDEKQFLQSLFDRILVTVRTHLIEEIPDLVPPATLGTRQKLFTLGGALFLVLTVLTLISLDYGSSGTIVEFFGLVGLQWGIESAIVASILGVILLAPMFAVWWRDNRSRISPLLTYPLERRLYDIIDARLERLAFDQKFTSASVAEIGPIGGVRIGVSSGMEFTRQPYTLVGLVEDIRQFASEVLTVFEKLYIGIDELDKMHDHDQVRQFLRGVKGIFSINGVCYVLTVSDEALRSFGLRNLSERDELDSSFRLIIRVGPLTVLESRAILAARGGGFEEAEATMLAILSGGNARELLRVGDEYWRGLDRTRPKDVSLTRAAIVKYLDMVIGLETQILLAAVRTSKVSDESKLQAAEALRDSISGPSTGQPLVLDARYVAYLGRSFPEVDTVWGAQMGQLASEVSVAITRARIRMSLLRFVASDAGWPMLSSDADAEKLRRLVELVEFSPLEALDEILKLPGVRAESPST